ncbi:MAG: hypothetical protein KDD47_24270 [Acidobacteria bacterium]|nr:hypothetical protein [Acidobacteriota bacterium]
METLRWACVPLVAIAVWYGTALLGIVGYEVLESLCPPELVVSGLCTAPWFSSAVDGLTAVCTAVVAAALVLVPAWVAPRHRFVIACLAYLFGAAFATYLAFGGGFLNLFLLAAASGSLALWAAWKKWPRLSTATIPEDQP